MTIDSMFYGPHRSGGVQRYEAERINRNRVIAQCGPVTVTAADLASAIDENGVDRNAAHRLVEKLIERARDVAVARTIGLKETPR